MPFLRRRSTLDLLTTELKSGKAERDASKPSIEQYKPTEPVKPLERPASANVLPAGRQSQDDPPGTPPIQPSMPANKRFSLMKFRTFSDSQLATRARLQAERAERPPLPVLSPRLGGPATAPPPAILTTAPTFEVDGEILEKNKKKRGLPFKRNHSKYGNPPVNLPRSGSPQPERSILPWRRSQDLRRDHEKRSSVASLNTSNFLSPQSSPVIPPPPPPPRNPSDSDKSTGNRSPTRGKNGKLGLFKGAGKDKRKSLFPLPIKIEPPLQYPDTAPATPRQSTSAVSTRSENHTSPAHTQLRPSASLARSRTEVPSSSQATVPFDTNTLKSSVSFAPRGAFPLFRNDSSHSVPSTRSSPVAQPRRLDRRDRSHTMSTFERTCDDETPPTPPTLAGSARNSTSTTGRASLGNFFTLNRFRHGSEHNGFKHDSPGTRSKSNSFAISRESFSLPERQEGETAAKYMERLQGLMSKTVIAGTLSKSSDPFFQNVLRSYTRRFAFFGDPIDMSLRKFLLEAELPKETQQVDRVIQAFADRYHECNPGIFMSSGMIRYILSGTKHLSNQTQIKPI